MDGPSPLLAGHPDAAVSRGGGSPLIGRYMLALLSQPLAATLGVVLPALLLERLLRLFDLVANGGAGVAPIIRLVLYLTPHYVGLALPAAFFVSVFVVVARLGEHHELDALQSSGLSLAQLSRPFMLVAALLAAAGIGLYGYLQPLGRYHYRAALHAVTHAGWNAALVPGEFTRIGRRLSVTADGADGATGQLRGVFVLQRQPDGTEVITTARSGWLLPRAADGMLDLELDRGSQISVSRDGAVRTVDFGGSAVSRPFSQAAPAFRARGQDEREMTLDELWSGAPAAAPGQAGTEPRRLEGELHGRLVRSLSLALLPLIAMPMGLSAKRARRWHGVVLSAMVMLLYHHAVQLAESLGDIGVVNPRLALWTVFLLFAAFCAGAFQHAQRNPSEGPFDAPLAWLERAGGAVAARLPRRGTQPT